MAIIVPTTPQQEWWCYPLVTERMLKKSLMRIHTRFTKKLPTWIKILEYIEMWLTNPLTLLFPEHAHYWIGVESVHKTDYSHQ